MSLPPPSTTRQSQLGLTLPITIEHFLSLEPKQQHGLIAEQVLGWWLDAWKEECSQLAPDAEWQNGSDYYAQKCTLWTPTYLDDALEDDEEALLD